MATRRAEGKQSSRCKIINKVNDRLLRTGSFQGGKIQECGRFIRGAGGSNEADNEKTFGTNYGCAPELAIFCWIIKNIAESPGLRAVARMSQRT